MEEGRRRGRCYQRAWIASQPVQTSWKCSGCWIMLEGCYTFIFPVGLIELVSKWNQLVVFNVIKTVLALWKNSDAFPFESTATPKFIGSSLHRFITFLCLFGLFPFPVYRARNKTRSLPHTPPPTRPRRVWKSECLCVKQQDLLDLQVKYISQC